MLERAGKPRKRGKPGNTASHSRQRLCENGYVPRPSGAPQGRDMASNLSKYAPTDLFWCIEHLLSVRCSAGKPRKCEKMENPPPTAPPRLCEKRLCPAAKKSRYTLKIWIFQIFTSYFVLFHHSKWFCCQRSLVTDAWKASKTVKKMNFDGFFWGGLPVSLQTVNFGVMSWQNQKEWYLQIKTVFILGWGKQTIKVWRHSEILGVEIYWPKVDDSAILSFFPHGTGPVPRFWPLRGIITFSILSRFVNFEREN